MQKIIPYLWFESEAEDAAAFYVSIFDKAEITGVSRYGEAGPGPAGSAMVVEFRLEGQDFMALNGGKPPVEGLPPIALFVTCETQAELDRVWDKLLDGGQTLQCGWIRDKYGISWNIVPAGMSEYLGGTDPVKSQRAMRAMLEMEKLDINALRRAYEGETASA